MTATPWANCAKSRLERRHSGLALPIAAELIMPCGMRVFVTGGAGFIGSALVRHLMNNSRHEVLNLDKLTYAGVLESLAEVADDPRYRFVQGDICDRERVRQILAETRPDVVFNLAAESHVDRSIDGPGEFVRTNVMGAFELLEAARVLFGKGVLRSDFRFVHVSTDEVFGSLGPEKVARRARRHRLG